MQLSPFLDGFTSPVCLRSVSQSLYIADQIGIIYRINNHSRSIFLDLRDKIVPLNPNYDERGLLAFIFSLDLTRIFVFYSTKTFNSRANGIPFYNLLSEFQIKNGIVEVNSEVILLSVFKHQPNHNGADLHFGPDNYLYLSLGDEGIQGDPNNTAQNLNLPYGKILRIDVSFPGKYRIPPDNPFGNEIYAFGFRNPWRMSFDSSGRLFVGDVGYEEREEVDIVVKGGNYGWPVWEGTLKLRENENKEGIAPIYEYQHLPGPSAVIGGYFIENFGYIFGDYNKTVMRIVKRDSWELVETLKVDMMIKSFGQDIWGNLYLLGSKGIYRVTFP